MKFIKLIAITVLVLVAGSAFATDSVVSFINLEKNVCKAKAPVTNLISTATAEKIKIVITGSNKVIATCHFDDDSAITLSNAEQQKIGRCKVYDENGELLVLKGTGHVAAAANDVGDFGGGNAVFTCKGDKIESDD